MPNLKFPRDPRHCSESDFAVSCDSTFLTFLRTSAVVTATPTEEEVSLFAFPSDPVVRKKWVIAIKRDEGKHFTITKYTKLCSGHFQQSDYLPNVAGNRRYLKQQAVPSVFAFNVSKKPPRKKPCERQPLPVVQRISIADDNVTSEALLKMVSEHAVGEAASKEASAVITDLNSEDSAGESTCQEEASNAVSNVNSITMEDLTGHVTHDTGSAVNEEATIGPVANNASDVCACQTAARGPTDSMHIDRLQNLQKQTESQAKLVQDLELDLESYKEQLRKAEDALSKAQSELRGALAKCNRVSMATVSKVCITWISYMYVHLAQLDLWLPRAAVDDAMPPAFKEQYSSTRVILDATEVQCKASSSL
ncbi:hypothetical protein HPB47_014354, partial [Ixodes persulcatus]